MVQLLKCNFMSVKQYFKCPINTLDVIQFIFIILDIFDIFEHCSSMRISKKLDTRPEHLLEHQTLIWRLYLLRFMFHRHEKIKLARQEVKKRKNGIESYKGMVTHSLEMRTVFKRENKELNYSIFPLFFA